MRSAILESGFELASEIHFDPKKIGGRSKRDEFVCSESKMVQAYRLILQGNCQ
jgi:hypothetical protein